MLELIKAALIAIPEINKILNRIDSSIVQIAEARAEANLQEVKDQLNTLTKRLENATTREEIASIVRDLNSIEL